MIKNKQSETPIIEDLQQTNFSKNNRASTTNTNKIVKLHYNKEIIEIKDKLKLKTQSRQTPSNHQNCQTNLTKIKNNSKK